MKKTEVLGLETLPEIKPVVALVTAERAASCVGSAARRAAGRPRRDRQGDNLAEIIINSADDEIGGLKDKDIIVLTSKIVSKALGRIRKLSEVTRGKKALCS